MNAIVLFLVLLTIVALALLWFVGRERAASRRFATRAPDWTFTDDSAEGWEAHARPPDTVNHELDLAEWKYRVLATWYNHDSFAESDTSVVREEYDAELDDQGGWRVRLVMRNGTVTDGRPWQPAASEFVPQWQSALDRRAQEDDDGR